MFEIFCPHGPKKKIVKNQKFKILKKKKKRSGNMVDRYLSLKFGVNPLDGTDGRTTDAHVMTVALLCSNTKQS